MKASDFERILNSMGFILARCGAHRVWSNGQRQVAVPHGKEINRMVAKRLLKEIAYPQSVPSINYHFKKLA